MAVGWILKFAIDQNRTFIRCACILVACAAFVSNPTHAVDEESHPSTECLKLVEMLSAPVEPGSYKKPRVWPKFNEAAQQAYESQLKIGFEVTTVPIRDQCLSGCGASSMASIVDQARGRTHPDDLTSANYVMARFLELQVYEATFQSDRPLETGIHQDRFVKVLQEFGASPVKLFPDNPDVDVAGVQTQLEALVKQYWAAKNEGQLTPAERDLFRNQVLEKARITIQAHFGKFPSSDDFAKSGYVSAHEYANTPPDAPRFRNLLAYSDTIQDEALYQGVYDALQHGTLPLLIYTHDFSKLDPRTGTFDSKNGFAVPTISGELPRGYLDIDVRHGLVITGIAKDAAGEVIVIAQNSHGSPAKLYFPFRFLKSAKATFDFQVEEGRVERFRTLIGK